MDNLKKLKEYMLILKKHDFTDIAEISIDGKFKRCNDNEFYGYEGQIIGDGIVYCIRTNKCNIPYEGEQPIYLQVQELIGKNIEGYNFVADITGID